MYSLETSLLKRKLSKTLDPDYPDQEAYPNLSADSEGDWQPLVLGYMSSSGTGLPANFINAIPTREIDPGTEMGSGNWKGRKFKVTQTIKNPETDTVHGSESDYTVLRYQANVVSEMTFPTNFIYANNNTEIHFNNDPSGQLEDSAIIRVHDGNAILDDAVGTFTGTASMGIVTVPNVIHFLLVCIAGIPTSRIDISSFTMTGLIKQNFSGTFNYPSWWTGAGTDTIKAYFDNQTILQQLVDTLAFSVGHKVVCSSDGVYSLRELPTLASGNSTTPGLVDADISNWQETLRLDSFSNRIIVKYFQVPGGAQQTEFDITKRKRRHKRKIVSLETEAFFSVRNTLTQVIAGVNVKDDLLYAIGHESEEFDVVTYWIIPQPAQDLADYLYLQKGRGCWQAKFVDADGILMSAVPGDLIYIYRKQSAHGDISAGKPYCLIDANANVSNNKVEISRLDEVH